MAKSSNLQTCAVCGETLRAGQQQCPMCDTPVAATMPEPTTRQTNSDADVAAATRPLSVKEMEAMLDASEVDPEPDLKPEEHSDPITASRPRTPAEVARAEFARRAEQKTETDAETPQTKSGATAKTTKLTARKSAPGVEQMRRRSSQVMDDAAIDSGLRFVVVALLLILFSGLIIFLSKAF